MLLPITPGDLLIVGTLVLLEGLLSADNALVMAILVKHLPKDQQKKALLYGLAGAFLMRGVAILFARYLMGVWWLCGVGAIYLIGLAGRHFVTRRHEDSSETPKAGASFWATVVQVEFTDLIFAVDSILVAVALVNDPAKVWIVYTGGFLGILLLRLAASFFIRLITQYPALDHMAYGLVGWAGVKLASAAMDIRAESLHQPEPHYLPTWAFWIGFVLIAVLGSLYAVYTGRTRPVVAGKEDQK
jgi:YkoY family integral membrane protein